MAGELTTQTKPILPVLAGDVSICFRSESHGKLALEAIFVA
jgi:hypothetical protein